MDSSTKLAAQNYVTNQVGEHQRVLFIGTAVQASGKKKPQDRVVALTTTTLLILKV